MLLVSIFCADLELFFAQLIVSATILPINVIGTLVENKYKFPYQACLGIPETSQRRVGGADVIAEHRQKCRPLHQEGPWIGQEREGPPLECALLLRGCAALLRDILQGLLRQRQNGARPDSSRDSTRQLPFCKMYTTLVGKKHKSCKILGDILARSCK